MKTLIEVFKNITRLKREYQEIIKTKELEIKEEYFKNQVKKIDEALENLRKQEDIYIENIKTEIEQFNITFAKYR